MPDASHQWHSHDDSFIYYASMLLFSDNQRRLLLKERYISLLFSEDIS